MTTNITFDRDKLIFNGRENPSTNQGADSYGTFGNDTSGSPVTTTTAPSYSYAAGSHSPNVMMLGGCPACKTGTLDTDFTTLGICCAIFLFPVGIICCFAFRQRRCNFCGAIFP